MTAAIALAVVLVIAVAGVSLAMQTQRPVTTPRPARPPRPAPTPRRHGRPPRQTAKQAPAEPEPSPQVTEKRGPELLRSGKAADARVVGVIDERITGSVVRSRLSLRVEPEGEDSFEVQIRHAFPTQEARAAVKVGGTVPVRFDPDDHHRVVIAQEMG